MNKRTGGAVHARRRPIVRARRLHMGGLAVAEREAVLERLYSVFCTYFSGHDRDTFASIALPTAETRLALLYADDGTLAGFTSNTIQRLTIDGRVHAAMGGSGFILPAYKGGTMAGAYTLSEAARFMLRHPRVPFGFLGALLGPTTYQRFARSFARVYPHRRLGFPPEVARLVREFARARNLSPEGAQPWTVNLGVRPLRTAPITAERARDPDVQYFCAANPGYVDGRALLVWIPLDAANIASAAGALARDGFRGALGWLPGGGPARA
ncbi:hypothetical protein [Nannocystis exedens]|nr:hypothetical protein [Nannocystis exedens]